MKTKNLESPSDLTKDHSSIKLIKELEDSLINSEDMEFGPIVNHPLVRLVLYTPDQNGYLNDLYKRKQRDLRKHISNKKWDSVLGLHERPWKAWAFTQFAPYMKPIEYWKNLSSVWTDTEVPNAHKDMWLDLFNANVKQKRKLMSSKERQVLQDLPPKVTIYRGYDDEIENTLMGISWTLSERTANWFATRFQSNGEPRIVEGQCQKSSILAYFDERNEEEIVINPVDVNIVDNRPAKSS